jgi:hypothetical protein
MRSTLGLLALAALLICTAALVQGCGMGAGGLSTRAAAYYNFMTGASSVGKASAFMSPAQRRALGKESVMQANQVLDPSMMPPSRYTPAAGKDVAVASKGRFAFTMVRPELGNAFSQLDPVRWVRVGMKWYLFTGSTAETAAYGSFPPDLAPPAPPAVKTESSKAQKKAAKTATDKKAADEKQAAKDAKATTDGKAGAPEKNAIPAQPGK